MLNTTIIRTAGGTGPTLSAGRAPAVKAGCTRPSLTAILRQTPSAPSAPASHQPPLAGGGEYGFPFGPGTGGCPPRASLRASPSGGPRQACPDPGQAAGRCVLDNSPCWAWMLEEARQEGRGAPTHAAPRRSAGRTDAGAGRIPTPRTSGR